MFRVLRFLLFCGICTIVLGDHETEKEDRANVKAGPYTSILTRMQKCKKPDLPYQTKKERSGDVTLELSDAGERKSGPSIKGNYTSFKEDPDLRLNITDYQQVNGKWEQILSSTGMNCYSRITARLARIFHVNYNKLTCAVPKGTYKFDADYDKVDHEIQSSRVYGKVLRRVVLTSKKKTVICLEFESEVTPAEDM